MNRVAQRFPFLVAPALSVSLLFSACAQAEPPAAYIAPTEPPAAAAAAPVDVNPAPAEATRGDQSTPTKATSERMVIHRAELGLSSDEVAKTADEAVAIVEQAKGYVASREEQHANSHVTQSVLSLRVPAAAFDRVLQDLKRGNDVLQERLSGQDVTAEYTDNAARLRAQRVLEERLLALSGSQQGVKDLLEVERELARVRSEIERLLGQQQLLENQTAMGTITLTVSSPMQPAIAMNESVWSQLGNAVGDGLEMSLAVTAGLIRVALAFLPFLPLPVVAYLLFRMRRRRLLAQAQAK